jgi:Sugar efflux transporter for intercellular exchange
MWFNLAASKLQFQQQFTPVPVTNNKAEYIASTSSEDSSLVKKEDAAIVEAIDDMVTTENNTTPPQLYQAPRHDYWVIGITTFWLGVAAVIGFGRSFSAETQQSIVGTVNNLNLVFFYGAPLSTIRTVLATRNAASIHIPTMLTNTANGVFWTAYGFAVLDPYLIVPNGLGAVLGFIQMFLCVVFRRVSSVAIEEEKNAAVVDEEHAVKQPESCQTTLLAENPSDHLLSAPFAANEATEPVLTA